MFQWNACCQCEVAKGHKDQIDFPAALDEGISAQDLTTSRTRPSKTANENGTSDEELLRPPTSADSKELQECASTPSTRSSASLDEEQRRAEKARLNALVVSFSKKAIVGLNCKVLGDVGGTTASPQYANAKFFFDKALLSMEVRVRGTQVTVPLVDVVEVFSYEHVPDCQLGKLLREEDRSRAVFIQHRVDSAPDSWLCLIVADEELQESAATCIKILQLYAQEKTPA